MASTISSTGATNGTAKCLTTTPSKIKHKSKSKSKSKSAGHKTPSSSSSSSASKSTPTSTSSQSPSTSISTENIGTLPHDLSYSIHRYTTDPLDANPRYQHPSAAMRYREHIATTLTDLHALDAIMTTPTYD